MSKTKWLGPFDEPSAKQRIKNRLNVDRAAARRRAQGMEPWEVSPQNWEYIQGIGEAEGRTKLMGGKGTAKVSRQRRRK